MVPEWNERLHEHTTERLASIVYLPCCYGICKGSLSTLSFERYQNTELHILLQKYPHIHSLTTVISTNVIVYVHLVA